MMDNGTVSHAIKAEPFLIIIVDDEIAIAETLAEFITDLGYTPLVAQNGQQALTLARQQWPALVLTDLMMPLLDGFGLIKALRAEATRLNILPPPVVLLTAASQQIMADIQADALLSKPFDLDQLEEIISQFIGPPPG